MSTASGVAVSVEHKHEHEHESVASSADSVPIATTAAATAAATTTTITAAAAATTTAAAASSPENATPKSKRAPALFVNHGGGPMPLLGERSHAPLTSFLKGTVRELLADAEPRAIVVVSAHWEVAGAVHVSSAQRPEMIFDYYGFPAEAYQYRYDAPGGSAGLVESVRKRLEAAKLPVPVKTEKRGFDHGVFVPLLLARPEADIPIVTVSLETSLDPAMHLAIGRALAPLRDEGIAIFGSGQSFHNMGAFRAGNETSTVASKKFNKFLTEICTTADVETRNKRLQAWETGPEARFCHPREEHLMPLLVVAGSSTGPAKAFQQEMLAKHCASFVFP